MGIPKEITANKLRVIEQERKDGLNIACTGNRFGIILVRNSDLRPGILDNLLSVGTKKLFSLRDSHISELEEG